MSSLCDPSPAPAAALPLLRPSRGAAPQATRWEAALDRLAACIDDTVANRGAQAVALLVSGWLPPAGGEALAALAVRIGTPRFASTSRLGRHAAQAAWRKAFPAAAGVPGAAAALEALSLSPGAAVARPPAAGDRVAWQGRIHPGGAKTLLVAGADLTHNWPEHFARIEAARAADAACKLIVVDPHRSATARAADLHLALLPGTEVVLWHAMLHLLLWEGLADMAFVHAHTQGFEALRDRVREFTPAHAARTCGVAEADIVQAARWFGRALPALSLCGQGLNQAHHGADRIGALVNLHLAAGQLDRDGAGVFCLAGQGTGVATTSDPGELFAAAAGGEVGLLWVTGADPLRSLPDTATVRRAFERTGFVVVQDQRRDTASAALGDLVLPVGGPLRTDAQIAAAVAARLKAPAPATAVPAPVPSADGGAHASGEVGGPTPPRSARFVAPAWRGPAETRDARFPVSLLTARNAAVAGNGPVLEMHPQELLRRRCRDGDLVRVTSRRGELLLPLHGSDAVPPAQARLATAAGPESLAGGGANTLLAAGGQQPELKHAAVRVERADLPWLLVAAAWLPPAGAAAARDMLREACFSSLRFASLQGFGEGGDVGIVLRVAHDVAPAATLVATIEAALALDTVGVTRYADPHSGQRRVLCPAADGSLRGWLLAGETRAARWAIDWLRARAPARPAARALLASAAEPPEPVPGARTAAGAAAAAPLARERAAA